MLILLDVVFFQENLVTLLVGVGGRLLYYDLGGLELSVLDSL